MVAIGEVEHREYAACADIWVQVPGDKKEVDSLGPVGNAWRLIFGAVAGGYWVYE